MKKLLGQLKRDILMLGDFISDYILYRKYNFGNYKNSNLRALEARIARQIHILEKGMSLSSPKIGFGQKKIQMLFIYLDDYLKKGGSIDEEIVEKAVGTLKAYMSFFKKQGYKNDELEEKISLYKVNTDLEKDCGIEELTLEQIREDSKKEFPIFLGSRHSVRQFANRPVEVDVIKKAVKVAMKTPSACNRQAAKVYVYTNKEMNNIIGETLVEGNTGFDKEVDKYLVITGERLAFSDSYERSQCIIDASLFAMNLVLALHYYGVGSCILQSSERHKLDKKRYKVLNIPESEKIVLFIAIGYYKEKFQVAKSKRDNIDSYLVVR